MSDFADDVDRYLTPSKALTPEQQASSLLFGDLESLPNDQDSRKWIEPGTGGKFVSFNEVVERYRAATLPPSLQSHRLVYLGSPYTKYAAGLDAAFRDVSAFAAMLLKDGVRVYSPIAHTHPIAIHGNLDPRNHEIWLPFDHAMMDAADAMCIADMDGWRESYGVKYEIDYFRKAGKPVYFCTATGDVSTYVG